MIGNFVILNGKLIKSEKATLPIDDIEFGYGFGVYENIRLRKGDLFFVKKHLKRLIQSAKLIDLEHGFKIKEIEKWVSNLVEKNQIETANIKILLIGGKTGKDARLFIIMLAPKFVEKKNYKTGVKVITKQYQRFLPKVKSLNMLPSYLIFREASKTGAYDALLTDPKNNIHEGTRSNFFAIKNKTIYTPPLNLILEGVTRETVIHCAKKNGYRIIEKKIKLNDVFKYDGTFLTNTSGKIVPIKTIDKKSFKEIPQELKNLIKLYNNYLKNICQ